MTRQDVTYAGVPERYVEVAELTDGQVTALVKRMVRLYGSDRKAAAATGFSAMALASWRRGDRRPATASLAALLASCGYRLRLVVEPVDSHGVAAGPGYLAPAGLAQARERVKELARLLDEMGPST